MRSISALALIAAGLLTLVAPARASHLVVPDDVPTVQQALDALVDTVIVKDGLVPERVTTHGDVVLEPYSAPGYPGFHSYPSLQSIEDRSWSIRMRGFRLLGQFSAPSYYRVEFEDCRFDSTLNAAVGLPGGPVLIRGCLVFGDLIARGGAVQLVGTTVIGGSMRVTADGIHDIRGNYVSGALQCGMYLNLQDSEGKVEGNTIVGCGEGMRIHDDGFVYGIHDNQIANCAGSGMIFEDRANPSGSLDSLRGNSIHGCGGAGISVGNNWSGGPIRQNQILDVGGDGITIAGFIILAVDSNTVLRAGGAGVRSAAFVRLLRGNVVGRCGSDGIVLASAGDPRLIEHNTSFGNAGAGFSLAGNTWVEPDTVRLNIAAANAGAGFALTSGPAPLLSCNDWYANTGGATQGMGPGASDLQLDPMFCYLLGNDVHLASGSPLLNAPGCGQIGALGQGCATALGVGSAPRLTIAPLRARPVPASRGVVFEIASSSSSSRLEVFDVSGARRWSTTLPAGAARLEWDRRDASGRPLPPGIYFARLAREGTEVATTRVVLTD